METLWGAFFCLFVVPVLFSEDTFSISQCTAECREGEEGEKSWEDKIILECSLPTGQNTSD